jgi:hypothetical protein
MLPRAAFPWRCGGDPMAKQSKKRQPRQAPANVLFVRAVSHLYRVAMKTKPWEKGGIGIPDAIKAIPVHPDAKLSEADQLQVRMVVIGLITIERALDIVYEEEDHEISEALNIEGRIPVVLTEMQCARQLLNALVDPSSDPAWRYISNL